MREQVAVNAAAIWDHDHSSSVGWVELAADEAACFESVDDARHGPGGQAGQFGEPSSRGGPVEQEEAERPEIGRVQTDVLYRLEVCDEQLDDEVAQVQLEVANGLFAA